MAEELRINGKAIYTPKGAAREYAAVGCNFYTGCPHGCEYCYLKRGVTSGQLGGTEVALKKCFRDDAHAFEVFCREVRKNIDVLRGTGIFFSFTTDPLIPETRDLTISAMNFCADMGVPVRILTKDAGFLGYTRMQLSLKGSGIRKLAEFGFTLTGSDDMEPNASGNYERICAMRDLHRWGFKTFASIEPVIDWRRSRMVVDMSLDCCDHYKIGLRSGVAEGYYDVLESGAALRRMVIDIVSKGRTVYVKESARKMLRRCFTSEKCETILGLTVGRDGLPYRKETES